MAPRTRGHVQSGLASSLSRSQVIAIAAAAILLGYLYFFVYHVTPVLAVETEADVAKGAQVIKLASVLNTEKRRAMAGQPNPPRPHTTVEQSVSVWDIYTHAGQSSVLCQCLAETEYNNLVSTFGANLAGLATAVNAKSTQLNITAARTKLLATPAKPLPRALRFSNGNPKQYVEYVVAEYNNALLRSRGMPVPIELGEDEPETAHGDTAEEIAAERNQEAEIARELAMANEEDQLAALEIDTQIQVQTGRTVDQLVADFAHMYRDEILELESTNQAVAPSR